MRFVRPSVVVLLSVGSACYSGDPNAGTETADPTEGTATEGGLETGGASGGEGGASGGTSGTGGTGSAASTGSTGTGASTATGGSAGTTGTTGGDPVSQVVQIDPADPHRLVRGGEPFFVAGYYPGGTSWAMGGVGFGDDSAARVRQTLEASAAQGINYTRAWLDWGSTTDPAKDPDVFWNSPAIAPYLRTGPGTATDGLPRYDLDQFNDAYFEHIAALIDVADGHGIVVQAMLFDCWHIGIGINRGYHVFDYFRAANNINGYDWSTHEEWIDAEGPVFAKNLLFVRRMVEAIGDRDNVVWETCNEKRAGNAADPVANATDPFHAGIAEAIHAAEAEFGWERHLVVPVDIPEHRTIAGHWLPTQGAGPEETLEEMHNRFVSTQFAWDKVLITDNDCCVGEPDANVLRRKAWVALASGAYTMGFNNEVFRNAILSNANTRDGMRFIGYTRDFVESLGVDLVGMAPHDELGSAGTYVLARPGEEWVVYVPDGTGPVTVSGVPNNARATWYDTQNGTSTDAGAGPSYSAPGGGDWALHIVRL